MKYIPRTLYVLYVCMIRAIHKTSRARNQARTSARPGSHALQLNMPSGSAFLVKMLIHCDALKFARQPAHDSPMCAVRKPVADVSKHETQAKDTMLKSPLTALFSRRTKHNEEINLDGEAVTGK